MPLDPTKMVVGVTVHLPGVDGPVRLLNVQPGPFITLTYQGASGLGQVTLSEEELAGVELVATTPTPAFNADPHRFRLGIEARRIRIAFEHDMAALAVSNIQPLPHQLEAVYECFLREPRVRFLLADDPGAGKTIMAGLYMKELILRRAGDRVLVVSPANLRAQWARELAERFDLSFTQLDSGNYDAHPNENPWDVYDRVIVSRDFLRTDRVLEAFEVSGRSWDLAVVDEAHGFTLAVNGKGHITNKSERYKAAEIVSRNCDRLILLTATPHSGRDSSLWSLLRLLDLDAWGDRMSGAPEVSERYYRKVPKEQMRDMAGNKLFKDRHPQTLDFVLEGDEYELYEAVTNFVAKQLREIRGKDPRSAAGFALTTMQRRLASSIRAIRRTLERRIQRIEDALADPEAYVTKRKAFRDSLGLSPDDIEDLDEEKLWALEEEALAEWLPDTIAELSAEHEALIPLLARAQELEAKRTERKLTELLDVVHRIGLREDQSRKLLIFTEHKDTLDYLIENLEDDFEVAKIHGSLKLAERIAQERYFRERAQIMVATEAAGEGINLQFCHLMVNYDIPWNPNRLEQRMGRIHRIGQTEDVYVFNLVARNTREGAVLTVLLHKLENMAKTLGDPVFDVIGKTFAGYRLRELIEAVLIGDKTREQATEELGGEEADPVILKRASDLLERALAKSDIDWEAERDRAERAEERRLPPAYFERFFFEALTLAGGKAEKRLDQGTIRVTRSPDALVAASRASTEFRQISPAYERITFDKSVVTRPRRPDEVELPQAELCGPGHPLFDALVEHAAVRTAEELAKGAVLVDPDAVQPCLLMFTTGETIDGNNEVVFRSFATIGEDAGGILDQPRYSSLYDFAAPETRSDPSDLSPRDPDRVAMWARQHVFEDHYLRARHEREGVANIQIEFLKRSFNALAAQADQAILAAEEESEKGVQGAEGRVRKSELAKSTLLVTRDRRIATVEKGRIVHRGRIELLGTAQLLPARPQPIVGDRSIPATNEEIEAIGVRVSTHYEEGRGASVESVEDQNVGFDLLSLRGPERRCIEVKGRAGVGGVELTWGEYAKAGELGQDYWLYVVLDCSSPDPRLYRVQDPVKALAGLWKPSLNVRFGIDPVPVIDAAEEIA
jgi:superfamily II DNA or RNA helicase